MKTLLFCSQQELKCHKLGDGLHSADFFYSASKEKNVIK